MMPASELLGHFHPEVARMGLDLLEATRAAFGSTTDGIPAFPWVKQTTSCGAGAHWQSLRTVTFRTLSEIKAFAEDWRELEAAAPRHLDWFQTYDWCVKWLQHHGGDTISPHVVAICDPQRLVALWPLMVERKRLGLRTLKILGDPHTQYSSILTRNGSLTPSQAAALRSAVLSPEVADTAVIRSVPEGSPIVAVIPDTFRSSALRCQSSMLDLANYTTPDEYFAALGNSQRRNRKKRRNAILKAGNANFRVLGPHERDFQHLIGACLAFKQEWLKHTGRLGSGLAVPNHCAFLGSLATQERGRDGPYLFALSVSGYPIAIEAGFLRNDHFYSYLGGFDWAWRDYSPGKVLMEMVVEWLIGRGVKAYDLLANRAAYKETWSNRTIALDTYLAELTVLGSIYSRGWVTTGRPALKKAYSALPSKTRAWLKPLLMRQKSIFGA
jgi:CelD/BcsL family acetyltransferase involved in cellulose biosynthesis